MRRALSLLGAALCLGLLFAAPAQAAFGFKALELGISGTQAGTHPDQLTTFLEMETVVEEVEVEPGKFKEREFPDGQLRDLDVDMPEGFAGNPTAVPRCAMELFMNYFNGLNECPNSTAIGYVAAKAEFEPIEPNSDVYFHVPLYNLPPEPGFAAKLGFLVIGVPVTIDVGVRESAPYGVYAQLTNTSEAALFYSSEVTIWGVPADSSHDALRGSCLDVITASGKDEPLSKGKCAAGITPEPFLTAPRSCEGPLTASFRGIAWDTGTEATSAASAPARSGCSNLGFEADASAQLSSSETESPSGLSFEMTIEDEGLLDPDPEAIAFSDMKSARVTLPPGVTVNPSQAEGLAACTESDLARETATSGFGAGCPAASKVGSVEVETPLLEGTVLKGSLFVAQPYQNPFGSLIALYMVIKDEKLGISVKLPAKVSLDPATGQVTTTFGDPSAKDPALRPLPQLPLGSVRVDLEAGPRSPLVTPSRCGSYEITSLFTPWANPESPLEVKSSAEITSGPGGGPCPSTDPFSPGFSAGSLNSAAGAFSPFKMRLTRNDGEADLTRLDALLPTGVVGKIAGVAQCSDAAIAAAASRTGAEELALPSCPASSRVGTVTAGAGVGSGLTWVKGGALYLAGPFAGAPLSVVAVVPALAGPFDLGVVVTREALDLDPTTAQVTVSGAASSPIPTILQGVPLRLRDLRIETDRPNFTLNPTSCEPKQARATAFSGTFAASLSYPYQASNCASLAFKPRLALRLKGKTRRGGHPALSSVLTPRPGDANIGAATVLLPRSLQIDNAHINNPCTRVQFNEHACPSGSVLGTASAYTPLLDQPLEGPVYFRSNGGERELPDIVADLHGQFRIIVVGFVDARNARIRARFLSVPDAPVSKFQLSLKGGKVGLLVNNRNLCGARQRAELSLNGQNGRVHETRPVIQADCKKKKSKHR